MEQCYASTWKDFALGFKEQSLSKNIILEKEAICYSVQVSVILW